VILTDIIHGSPDWRVARKGKINCSTAANILYPSMRGVRGTPLSEYIRITNELDGKDVPEDVDDSLQELFDWGTKSERLHLEILGDKYPDILIAANNRMIVHDQYSFIVGTPDAFCSGYAEGQTAPQKAVIELKAPVFHDPWGDECPIGPQTQARLYAMMANADYGMVSALIPPSVNVYKFDRDLAWEDWATTMLVNFWNDHIVKRVPPPAQYAKDLEALKDVVRAENKEVSLDASLRMYGEMLDEGKAMADAGEEMQRHARAKILEAMGDAEVGRFEEGDGFSYLPQTRKTPAREASTSTFRVFRQLKK
jgi:hypothetical protein